MKTERFRHQLERLPDEERDEVVRMAERLIESAGYDDDRALFDALRDHLGNKVQFFDDDVADPDVSISRPHGTEGEHQEFVRRRSQRGARIGDRSLTARVREPQRAAYSRRRRA